MHSVFPWFPSPLLDQRTEQPKHQSSLADMANVPTATRSSAPLCEPARSARARRALTSAAWAEIAAESGGDPDVLRIQLSGLEWPRQCLAR